MPFVPYPIAIGCRADQSRLRPLLGSRALPKCQGGLHLKLPIVASDERVTAAQNLGQEMNGQLTNLKTTIADRHQDHLILSERQHQWKFKAMDSPSGSLSPVAIDLAGVSKSYGGKIVVNDLSFTIAAGECFGLLGPNGAGKSTITRMILGMTSPSVGKITVLGAQEPGQVRLARAKIGIVSQFDNLDLEFTVRENLLVYGRYFRMKCISLTARATFSGLGISRKPARVPSSPFTPSARTTTSARITPPSRSV